MVIFNSEKIKRKSNAIETIINISFINYVLVMFLPIYERLTITYITVGLNVFLVFMIILINKIDYKILISIIIFSIMEFSWAISINANLIMKGYDLLLWIIPVFIIIHYKKKIKHLKRIILLVLFSIAITSFTSYLGLLKDPEAARFLATVSSPDDPYYISLNLKNIGGFTILYQSVIVIPIVISLWKRKLISHMSFLLIIIPVGLYIIEAQYTLALLFSLIAFSTFIFPRNKKVSFLKFASISIIGFILITRFISQILMFIADNIDSTSVYERLRYLAEIFKGNIDINSPVNIRFDLYLKSINSIIKYNVIGGWMLGNPNILSGHSFILDTIAKFGLAGLLLLIALFRTLLKSNYEMHRDQYGYIFSIISFAISLMISVVNPFNSLFLIYFFIPIVLTYEEYISKMKITQKIERS